MSAYLDLDKIVDSGYNMSKLKDTNINVGSQ